MSVESTADIPSVEVTPEENGSANGTHDERTMKAESFDQLMERGSLQWELQTANWAFVNKLMDLDQEMTDISNEIYALQARIGGAVTAGKESNRLDIQRVQNLERTLRHCTPEMHKIKDDMRQAMRGKMNEMLPTGVLEQVSDDAVTKLLAKLEETSRVQLRFSRLLNGANGADDGTED